MAEQAGATVFKTVEHNAHVGSSPPSALVKPSCNAGSTISLSLKSDSGNDLAVRDPLIYTQLENVTLRQRRYGFVAALLLAALVWRVSRRKDQPAGPATTEERNAAIVAIADRFFAATEDLKRPVKHWNALTDCPRSGAGSC